MTDVSTLAPAVKRPMKRFRLPPKVEAATSHCDLVERLRAIPSDAQIRGVYMKGVVTEMEKRGLLPTFLESFPDPQVSSISFYPLGDYLMRMAYAGALIASPEGIHDGIKEASKIFAVSFGRSLLGKTLIRALSKDPTRLLQQGMVGKRQTCSYGKWTLVQHATNKAEVVLEQEYVWIESCVLGSFLGTFEFSGVNPEIELKLKDRFNGSLTFSW
jgi:uncharacterized protein (TIGR02265 family)